MFVVSCVVVTLIIASIPFLLSYTGRRIVTNVCDSITSTVTRNQFGELRLIWSLAIGFGVPTLIFAGAVVLVCVLQVPFRWM